MCRRMAATTGGPIVRLGTKCPSITSTCSQSASERTRSISAPRAAKSADRMEGAIRSIGVTLLPAPARPGRTSRPCRRPGAAAARPGPGWTRADREAAAGPARPGPGQPVVNAGRLLVGEGADAVDQDPTWPYQRDGRTSGGDAASRPRRSTSPGCTRQRASGRRRNTPSPEQGASTRTRSKVPARQGGRVPSATTVTTGVAARRATVAAVTAAAGLRDVGGHDQGGIGAGEGRGLASGGGAHVEDAIAWPGADVGGHQLAGPILGVAVGAGGRRGRLVHGQEGVPSRGRAQLGQETVDDPVRVAQLGGGVGPGDRPGRQLGGHPAQDRVDQRATRTSHRGHRGRHRGVRRDAGPAQLVGAQPQGGPDLVVQVGPGCGGRPANRRNAAGGRCRRPAP